MMFLSINYVGFNKIVYLFLERLDGFQDYFTEVCPYLACICMMMTIGMGVWKIMWGTMNPKEFFVKLFMNICMYFILMALYPIAMKGVLKLGTTLGYGAVYNGGKIEINLTQKDIDRRKSKDGFYTWLSNEAGSIFVADDSEAEKTAVTNAMNFNLIDRDTGYIDLNKLYLYPVAFFTVMMKYMPKVTSLSFLTLIPTMILVMASTVIFVVVLFFVIVNYIMALVDYFALCGFGILMIPLLLWDGTKDYTQKLFGSIGQILIKLMVNSAILFLDIMTVVDGFGMIYKSCIETQSVGGKLVEYMIGSKELYPMCLIFILQSIFMYAISKNTDAIAGFITGGAARMSFGEFANAASQAVTNMGAGISMGRGAANAVSNTIHAGNSAVAKGMFAGNVAMQNGAGKAGAIGAGLSAFGGSIVGSLGSQAASGMASAAESFKPENLKKNVNGAMRQLGLTHGIDSEGYGGSPFSGIGPGGSSGGGGDGGSNGDITRGSSGDGSGGGDGNPSGGNGGNPGRNSGIGGSGTGGQMSVGENSPKFGKSGSGSSEGSSPSVGRKGGDGGSRSGSDGHGQAGPEGANGGLNASSGEISDDSPMSGSVHPDGEGGRPLLGGDGGSPEDTSAFAVQTQGDAEAVTRGHAMGLDGPYGAVNENDAMQFDRDSMKSNPMIYQGGVAGGLYHAAQMMGSSGNARRGAVERAKQWANLNSRSNDAGNRSVAKAVGFAAQWAERRLDRQEAKDAYKSMMQGKKDYDETGVYNHQAVKDWNNLSQEQKNMVINRDGSRDNAFTGFFKDVGNTIGRSFSAQNQALINSGKGVNLKTGNMEADRAIKNNGGVYMASLNRKDMNGDRNRKALRSVNGFKETEVQRMSAEADANAVRQGFEKPVKTENEAAVSERGGKK